jgi:hypothetical protein
MKLNYRRLLELHEQKGAEAANHDLRALFEAKEIRPTDIDLGRLFVECFGWHNFVACRNREQLANDVFARALTEAEGAVSTAAFTNISGQFVYQTVMDAYTAEESVFRDLIPEAPASTLDGEKIPGVTEIGDEIAVRKEGDPYALAGPGEDWIFTPPIVDRGVIIPLTWEALFNDKTGQVSTRCGDVGKWGGISREKAAIDCCIDENRTDHRYNWKGFGRIASYGDNSGFHTWDNLAATNTITDHKNIDTAEQVFNALIDPTTGEPILFDPIHLTCAKQNEQTARRILSSSEIRVTSPGYATAGNPTQTVVKNPYQNKYELKTSRLLGSRMNTKTDWYISDWTRYAKCMVAEKANVVQAPANNKDEFERRIVNQWRFNERYNYVVVQPRASVKNTVS